jgi:hypothetical protein
MNFIEEIRKITKVNRRKNRSRGTKKIIKKTKKQIQRAAKEGKYEATYYVPNNLLFYKSHVEYYFNKEGFTCLVKSYYDHYLVKVSWKEEEYNDNY